LESPDFQPSLAKKYIDQKFVLQVMYIPVTKQYVHILIITEYQNIYLLFEVYPECIFQSKAANLVKLLVLVLSWFKSNFEGIII